MKNQFYSLFLVLGLGIVFGACQNNGTNEVQTETKAEVMIEKDTTLEKFGVNSLSDNALGGLKVGDSVEDFSGKTVDGTTFNLNETLANQEVLLVFYRGYWCGYCQKHLSELEENLTDFEERGIKVLAVTPESPEYAMKSVEKSDLNIDIIPDQGYEIMKKYNVLFEVNEDYLEKLAKYEIEYDTDPVTGKTFFPIPATYLIGKDGKVKFAHYDPDYSKRSDVEELLKV